MADEKTVVVAEGEDVLMIQCVSGEIAYKAEVKGEDGEMRPTKMVDENGKIKTYWRYTYGGITWTSDDRVFHKANEEGDLSKVTFDKEGKYLRLTGYITFKKRIGMKRNNLHLESLTVENFVLGAAKQVEELEELA